MKKPLTAALIAAAGGDVLADSERDLQATEGITASAAAVIEALELEGHVEGGFFRRTYQADRRDRVTTPGGERYLMTSIFYLLTSESPVGHFHRNESDIVHYFQLGDPITYYLLYPDGHLETVVMGADILRGQQLQLTVPGGVWKASRVATDGEHGFGLISEAVAPGFDYADMTLARADELIAQFPDHARIIRALSHAEPPR
jgi:predicted cupin superfamily sugar epimerase